MNNLYIRIRPLPILLMFLWLCLFKEALGQNRAISLYRLSPGDQYPADMPHVKSWLDQTLAPLFLRNLQFSDNARGSSKFLSFTPFVSESKLRLPGFNGLTLQLSKGNFTGQFDNEIQNYRSFDINTFDYSLKSYFLLSADILKLTPESMIAHSLNYFVEGDRGTNKFKSFIDQVNKKMGTKLPYSTKDEVRDLSLILQTKFPGRVPEIIYQTFIADKSEESTKLLMQQYFNITGFFYDGPVIERIDRLIFPRLILKQPEGLQLNLSAILPLEKGQMTDSTARFFCENIGVVLNYKKKMLEITFNGRSGKNLNLQAAKAIAYDSKSKSYILKIREARVNRPVELEKIMLLVGESELVANGFDTYGSGYRLHQSSL